MSLCTECGKELPMNANFCPNCGEAVNSCEDMSATKTESINDINMTEETLSIKDAIDKNPSAAKSEKDTKDEWFFLKYWRGNYSLGESVAIYVLINIVSNAFFCVFLRSLMSGFALNVYLPEFAIIPFLLVTIYQVVGCWRSANKHPGKTVWRYVVYTFIVLALVVSVTL